MNGPFDVHFSTISKVIDWTMTIRSIVPLIIVLLILARGGNLGCSERNPNSKEIIYAGTFAGRGSQGLYAFEFNRKTGQLTQIQTIGDREGPNFQAIHPEGRYLYSVSREAFSEHTDSETITVYQIDQETGTLTKINEQMIEGLGAAHVSIDPYGKFAYVSNYGSGNLIMFSINQDGSLSETIDKVQHEGSSVNMQRQEAPHVHSAIPSADGRFLYVSDLGIDKIMIYEIDQATGKLTPAETPYVENSPGAGPRHFTIHPDHEFAYAAEELSSTVAAFRVESTTGALTQFQRVDMLPDDFEGSNTAADIHISPDGRFLYASNRGHNSLVIYEIDESNGELSLVGFEPTRGGHPRNFMIDQQGEFVLVANRDDDNVVVFRRNKTTGKLSYTGQQAGVPMVVCLTQHIL